MKTIVNFCFMFWVIVTMFVLKLEFVDMILWLIIIAPVCYCVGEIVGGHYNELIKKLIGGN